MTTHQYDHLFAGLDVQIPLLNGSPQRYTNLDNAASTPALRSVQQAVNDFLQYYSSVHRGTGFKSQLSTYYYEMARKTVLDFLGASADKHTCIFVKNTTEALNKLAHRFPFTNERNVVITSAMEHHSNDLPWRQVAEVYHIGLLPDGRLDEADFDRLLAQHTSRLALVTVSGASNVTGFLNPTHRLAEKTHAAGALFAVDCAQLAPHRQVEIGALQEASHFDFVAISAHKLYAPFGSGALVGRKDFFEQGEPDMVGGGTVEIVTLEDVVWSGPPDKEEAGSPNVIGAIALAAALQTLQHIGMEHVAQHEAELTQYALEKLHQIPGIKIYGDQDTANTRNRLGVIPFNLGEMSHFLVAAILGYEFGIGVRNGCFCAHPYILKLLGLDQDETQHVRSSMLAHDKSEMPGLVRISFGLYNSTAEVDRLVEALHCIEQGQFSGQYTQNKASGEYFPQGWQPRFEDYFSFSLE